MIACCVVMTFAQILMSLSAFSFSKETSGARRRNQDVFDFHIDDAEDVCARCSAFPMVHLHICIDGENSPIRLYLEIMLNRRQVVECNPDNIPPSTNPGEAVSPFLSRFVSLRDLCTSYPYGLGIDCHPNGRLVIRHPLSLMFRGPPNSQYLQFACRDRCVCLELGPNDPGVTTPERPACVADVGQDVVAADVQAPPPQCTAPTTLYSEGYTPSYQDRHWCDEYW